MQSFTARKPLPTHYSTFFTALSKSDYSITRSRRACTLTVRSSRRSSVYWTRISLTSICRSLSRFCCCCTIDRSSRTQLWSCSRHDSIKQVSQRIYTAVSTTINTTRSTQPCIPPGSLNRVPASAGVRAGMPPLPGGR